MAETEFLLDGFDPLLNGDVRVIREQADGKILLGGDFTMSGTTTRAYLARFDPDGTIDSGFDPVLDGVVREIFELPDGDILVGGFFTTVDGVPAPYLVRLDPNGERDSGFAPGLDGAVYAVERQADGKLLVGGDFTMVGADSAPGIARIEANGDLDPSFVASTDGSVNSISVRPGGEILIGGFFGMVNDTDRVGLAKLGTTGTLDTTFAPSLDRGLYAFDVQADGAIVAGGVFFDAGGTGKRSIARFDASGAFDATFTPDFSTPVLDLVVRPDGKILVGGVFSTISGLVERGIARLLPDGSADFEFRPGADGSAFAVAIQHDGRAVVGGNFNNLRDLEASRIGRLLGGEATSELIVGDEGRSLLWERTGAAPELTWVDFEQTVNNGLTWQTLGRAERIGQSSSWQASELNLPADPGLIVRARGYRGSFYRADLPLLLPTSLQPDLSIGPNRKRFRGENIYNRSGARQNIAVSSRKRAKAFFRCQNAGNVPDRFRIESRARSSSLKISYLRVSGGRRNVTAGMIQGRYRTGVLPQGEGELFFIRISTARGSSRNNRINLRPLASSLAGPVDRCRGSFLIR